MFEKLFEDPLPYKAIPTEYGDSFFVHFIVTLESRLMDLSEIFFHPDFRDFVR